MLVLIVVLVFLQSWRATIIPLCAVPVSLVGTFAAMQAFGFSLNNLSLFGLVLAIGIVVDDAIVVVEAVERNIEQGMDQKEAARRAMDQVGGAVVAIAVVLSAVFIPTAFISGLTGEFYRQFALTVAASTLISAFNSLTLSPALAGLLLRPRQRVKDPLTWIIDLLFGWFFRLFNQTFDLATRGYAAIVRRLLRGAGVVLLLYLGLLCLTALSFKMVPTGFIPIQDQGYLIATAQLPDGASLQRSDEVRKQMVQLVRTVPGVAHTVEFTGYSGIDASNQSNAVTIFVTLAPFQERIHDARLTGFAILEGIQKRFLSIEDARALVFPPPAVQGLGNAGGFKLEIQDRRGTGLKALQAATDNLIQQTIQQPGIAMAFTTFRSQVPQLFLNIDRQKAESLGVEVDSVFDTLHEYLG